MTLHFNKHYKGYINKLNEAMGKRSKPQLRELVISANKHNDIIRNNAGGAYNHQLLWQMMTPNPKPINGDIKDTIEKKYKSFDSFKAKFTESALSNFGSGWTWLVLKGDKLDIINTPNQDNPLMSNKGKPILGIDIWEHAYYKKYGPDREKYINNYMKVIDWDFCNTLLNN